MESYLIGYLLIVDSVNGGEIVPYEHILYSREVLSNVVIGEFLEYVVQCKLYLCLTLSRICDGSVVVIYEIGAHQLHGCHRIDSFNDSQIVVLEVASGVYVVDFQHNSLSNSIVEIRRCDERIAYRGRICNGIVGGVSVTTHIAVLYCELIGSCCEIACIGDFLHLQIGNLKIRLNLEFVTIGFRYGFIVTDICSGLDFL